MEKTTRNSVDRAPSRRRTERLLTRAGLMLLLPLTLLCLATPASAATGEQPQAPVSAQSQETVSPQPKSDGNAGQSYKAAHEDVQQQRQQAPQSGSDVFVKVGAVCGLLSLLLGMAYVLWMVGGKGRGVKKEAGERSVRSNPQPHVDTATSTEADKRRDLANGDAMRGDGAKKDGQGNRDGRGQAEGTVTRKGSGTPGREAAAPAEGHVTRMDDRPSWDGDAKTGSTAAMGNTTISDLSNLCEALKNQCEHLITRISSLETAVKEKVPQCSSSELAAGKSPIDEIAKAVCHAVKTEMNGWTSSQKNEVQASADVADEKGCSSFIRQTMGTLRSSIQETVTATVLPELKRNINEANQTMTSALLGKVQQIEQEAQKNRNVAEQLAHMVNSEHLEKVKSLTGKVAELERENRGVKQKYDGLLIEQRTLKERMDAKQRELDQKDVDLKHSQKELVDQKLELDHKTQLLEKQADELERMRRDVSQANEDRKKLGRECAEKEELLQQRQSELDSLKQLALPYGLQGQPDFDGLRRQLEDWLARKPETAELVRSSLGQIAMRQIVDQDTVELALRNLSLGISETMRALGKTPSEILDEMVRWRNFLMKGFEDCDVDLPLPNLNDNVDSSWMTPRKASVKKVSGIVSWAVSSRKYGIRHNAVVD